MLDMKDNSEEYEIYTDGGYSRKNNLGGYAFIILQNNNIIKKGGSGVFGETNNRCELNAIISAVSELPYKSSAIIFTDSQYCIGALSKNWKLTKNLDLVAGYHIIVDTKKLRIRFKWVKGHNGNQWNEECDKMCNNFAGLDLNAEYNRKKKKENDLSSLSYIELVKLYKRVREEITKRNNKVEIRH